MLWWTIAGCGSSAEEPPVVLEAPVEERAELEPFRGRWGPVVQQADGTWARCERGPAVEVRGDARLGWDLVRTGRDELQISAIGPVSVTAEGVRFELVGEPAVSLRWVVAERVATFPELHGEQAFVAPGVRRQLPTVACGG